MTYVLGSKSILNLNGVHPRLVAVVRRAIEITEQDFSVFEGIRTPARQREYVARGVSKTMASKHLVQPDGYGHAVDLVPYIDGSMRWEWPPIYHIANAMAQVARAEGLTLTWGGVWDRPLNTIRSSMEIAVQQYCNRHPGPDFIDGPHYEIRSL